MELKTSGTESANQLCKSVPLKVILDGDYNDDDNDKAYNDEIVMMMMIEMTAVIKTIIMI